MDVYGMNLHGRRKILVDYEQVTDENVSEVLQTAFNVHTTNRSEIEYLYRYYKGDQPILYRVKEIRPEINNTIVENRANEIVSFKVGYLMGEPIQNVLRTADKSKTDALAKLNDYLFAEDKPAKDKELAEWMHICGTSFRIVLPDEEAGEVEDESPFEIYTLDPRNTFVIYSSALGQKPIAGVTYVTRSDTTMVFSVYTPTRYYEFEGVYSSPKILPNPMGMIPIIEYPMNSARLGAFEIVIPLLDAINNVASDRMDGVDQFIQSFIKFVNCDIDEQQFTAMKQLGAIKINSSNGNAADVEIMSEELNQSQTQVLKEDLYDSILTICGMPNRNGGFSTSDTGAAVIMRDGWSSAEARAKDTELMFKMAEKQFLKIVMHICRELNDFDLKLSDIEIRFTRRNYENILEKSQVLTTMLQEPMIDPRLAFQSSGMFVDPELAYEQSMEYYEEHKDELEIALTQAPDPIGDAL